MNPGYRQQALSSYQSNARIVSPLEAIVLLYEGVIKALHRTKECYDRRALDEEFDAIEQAVRILTGLRQALDHEAGGEVAKTLETYYTALIFQIIAIPSRRSIPDYVDRLINQVMVMRQSWVTILKGQTAQTASGKTDEHGA